MHTLRSASAWQRYWRDHQDQLDGTIKLMFQPAEETVDGAMGMINDGVLDEVDVALGLHVYSSFPTGTTVVRSGPMMAAADEFRIDVHGRGGHAAHPEQAIDSVLVASQIVCALQTIVSRSLSPEETGVVTVGSIHAGEAHNVIAASAMLRGTIRSFTEEVRSLLHTRLEEIARGVAATFGAEVNIHIRRGVDPTVNAPGPTAVMYEAVRDILGSENINTTYRTTGGEDFSAVLARVPGNFLLLGARDDERGFNFPAPQPTLRYRRVVSAAGCRDPVRCRATLSARRTRQIVRIRGRGSSVVRWPLSVVKVHRSRASS